MKPSRGQSDSAAWEGHQSVAPQQGGNLDQLKRSWWILFTLVPFGWLGFVAFFYAGRKASRTSWKLWALAYFVLSWGATVLASVEELAEPWRQAGGMIMLFVAWPLPLVHALRIRRTYLDRTGDHDSPAETTSLDETTHGAWRPQRRSRWLAVAFVFSTALGAVVTVIGTGSDRVWGVIMLLFFGAGGASLYIPKSDRTGGGATTEVVAHRGRHMSALVFPFDSRRHRIRSLSVIAFAVTGLLMVLFADEMGEPGSRYNPGVLFIAGLLMLIFFGWFALASLRRFNSAPRLALLSEGVLLEGAAMPTFVPWDAVETIGVISMHNNEMLGISVHDRRRVETSRVGRLLLPLNRLVSPAEITQPIDAFVARPEVVVATLEHYFTHPEERSLLETGEAAAVDPATSKTG